MDTRLKNILTLCAAAVIAGTIGAYFRLYPLLHFNSSDASEKATVLVLGQLRNSINRTIEKNYAELPSAQKSQLAKKQFDELLKQKGAEVRTKIDELAQQIEKSGHSTQKTPYLLESDSFLYYSLTENIVHTGRLSETIKGSKYLNERMLAPFGHWEPLNLHPYIGFFIYKLMSAFNPKTELMYAVSFTPVVVAFFAVAAFFLVCRQLNIRLWISFISAIFFALAPIFIKRSTFGWYDNDPYNFLFPLLVLTALFCGLKENRSDKQRNQTAFAVFTALALYSLFWHGWMFLLSVVVAAGTLIVIVNRRLLKFFTIVVAGSFTAIGLLFGPREFFVLFQEGFKALNDFMNPSLSLWPDLYLSVGELKTASWEFIMEMTGGPAVVGFAIVGLVMTWVEDLRRRNFHDLYKTIVLTIFLAAALTITLGAQRFVVLSLIPIALFFALGLEKTYSVIIPGAIGKLTARPREEALLHNAVAVLLCGLILYPIWTAHKSTRLLMNQIYNETWDTVMTKLRTETPPDSIINTWWTPGHFIKAMAKRRVTFDGASINFPQAYWLANAFLTNDEREAAGILRMLNVSANRAAEYLQSTGMELSVAVPLIKKIVVRNRAAAQNLLKEQLAPEQTEHLLTLTHARPPPSYLLVFNEMAEGNIEYKFVGGWDFAKIEKIAANKKLKELVPARKSKNYLPFLWEIAGGPLRYNPPLPLIARQGSRLLFEQGVTIDLDTMQARVESKKFGTGTPRSIYYLDGSKPVEKVLYSADLPYSLLLYKEDATYDCIPLDQTLAKSLLMRLYFLKGKGLRYFEPAISETDLTRRTQIYVYKINWELFEKDLND